MTKKCAGLLCVREVCTLYTVRASTAYRSCYYYFRLNSIIVRMAFIGCELALWRSMATQTKIRDDSLSHLCLHVPNTVCMASESNNNRKRFYFTTQNANYVWATHMHMLECACIKCFGGFGSGGGGAAIRIWKCMSFAHEVHCIASHFGVCLRWHHKNAFTFDRATIITS